MISINILSPRAPSVFENYIRPAGVKLIHATVELVKCCTVYYFLELSVLKIFNDTKKVKIAYTLIRSSVVFAPLTEELFFRGVIQRGIGLLQRAWNYNKKTSELTIDHLRNQKIAVLLRQLFYLASRIFISRLHLPVKNV